MPAVRVQALAKVNLGLRILYRRPDGYHELRTIFQTISLADRLRVEYRRRASGGVELTANRPELAGPDNLAARAATVLLEATGARGQVRIHLEKRIPIGAGLGGGSSDAAAVLRSLASLLRTPPPRALLFRLAAQLGSDVAFFLLGGTAVGLGRGEEVYPLPDVPRRWMVVAAPAVAISTAEAYQRLSPHLTSHPWEDKINSFCSSACAPELCGLERGLAQGFSQVPGNDFEEVVFRMHPELERLKARLAGWGARPALLSGSGSAVFGLFSDRRQALRARDSLDLDEGSCFLAQTIGRKSFDAKWRRWLARSG